MAKYELIIERTQPTCGGKSPRTHEFRNVETDDPMAYVLKHEPNVNPSVSNQTETSISISFVSGVQQVTYEFTLDD